MAAMVKQLSSLPSKNKSTTTAMPIAITTAAIRRRTFEVLNKKTSAAPAIEPRNVKGMDRIVSQKRMK